jgi:hypothetical protein
MKRVEDPMTVSACPLTVHNFQQAPPQWIEVDNAKLAYRRIGSGPDVLFVHGWPLSSSTWR